MINSLGNALSALKVGQTRLDVTANNIANVSTEKFQQKTTNISEQSNGGVKVDSISPPRNEKETNINNVNLEEQMVGLIQEQHYYSANLQTIKTSDKILGSLINIKA